MVDTIPTLTKGSDMNIKATCTNEYPHRGLVIDTDTNATKRRTVHTYRTPEQAIEAAQKLINEMMEKAA